MIPALVPAGEFRALTLHDVVPAGHIAVPVLHDRWSPHIQAGEFAVLDPSDTEPQIGELYGLMIGTVGTPRLKIVQPYRSKVFGGSGGIMFVFGASRPGAMVAGDGPLRRGSAASGGTGSAAAASSASCRPSPWRAPMLERRSMLAGLAALPVAGLPIAAIAAAHADPFIRYGAEILALHAAIDACEDDAASDPLMDRWGEIDAQAMAGRPTTLAGAIGALEYARREVHQFHIVAVEDTGDDVCPGDRLVLHLLDGAIAVLRQAAGGGVA